MTIEKNNVVLVVPPGGYFAERWKDSKGMPELGVLYLAAVLEKEGFNISFVSCSLYDYDLEQLGKKLFELQPDIVGVTATTENRFQSFEVLNISKQIVPKALTVIGGPHVTNSAEDTLFHLRQIDVVVRGEGEKTIVELARTIRDGGTLEEVYGLSFRNNDGTIQHNDQVQPINNLDELPFPARHLVDYNRYGFMVDVPNKGKLPAANLMTSRGCPFNCNFCATPANWGRNVRTISPERVFEEIELVKRDYNAQAIWFYDDTFNLSKKRMESLCNGFLSRDFNISWFCEVRLDLLDKKTLTLMKKAGCFNIGFGVESGSERVRKEIIRKNFELDQARQVIEWCNELDIIANPFFIVSHPSETPAELRETLKVMNEFKEKTKESLSILHVYPGTDLEHFAREHGQIPSDYSWTRKKDPRIVTLPAAQGEVPLFIDKLSWFHIGEVLFKWSTSQGYSVTNKIPSVLKNIRSWRDFYRYGILFLAFIIYRLLPKILGNLNKKSRV